MFKIDKNTHMLILFTFALIFVVVYLYYTIIDVRKMQKEIKRLNDEIVALRKSPSPPQPIVSHPQVTTEQVPVKATKSKSESIQVPIVEITQTDSQVEKKNMSELLDTVLDDADSVVTDEIRDTLNCTDDEEEVVANPEVTSLNATSQEVQDILKEIPEDVNDIIDDIEKREKVDINELVNMKYDDLKDLCKKHNLTQKGTKEVLIKRLAETLC